MVEKVMKFIKRGRFAVAGALFALSVASAGAATFGNPKAASADSCDPVNIVYCGLDQRSLQTEINSFQADYQHNGNNGHHDLQTVYQWAGATDSSVNHMSTGNIKLGTMYRNGDIKVNGQVVGHDAAVSARFGAGQAGFHKIAGTDGVYWRLTTTSLAESSTPVIVHFDGNGQMDFAVMVTCGNAVKATPVVPPKLELACTNLAGNEVGTTRKYTFKAHASAKNTTITKYVFDFDDHGATDTVKTSDSTASSAHTYSADGQSFRARVTVYSKDFPNGVTSGNCVFKATTPSPQPSLVCSDLSYDVKGLNYTFTATAAAKNTTIKSYVFHLSDQQQPITVNTSASSATIKHTFAKYDTTYTVYVIVNSDKLSTKQTVQCSKTFKTPKQNECKPGIPAGSPKCTECTPVSGTTTCTTPTPPTTPTPTTLPNTGATGIMALFGISSTAGVILHRFILRKFLLG